MTVRLDRIEHNARTITDMCSQHGIAVCGVTKGCCGDPEVARAMLRGGVSSIGESRLANIDRLRLAELDTRFLLLRIPPPSDATAIVGRVDLSLQSELTTLAALSRAAERRQQAQEIIVMVDMGDLREGVWPDRLPPLLDGVARLPNIRVVGIGTNLSCFGGIVPSVALMQRFVNCAEEAERQLGYELEIISGGASSSLPLIAAGTMPARVNHVRIGEAILLGCETSHRRPLHGTVQDAVTLSAEVIELQRKPSLPVGEIAEDAYGHEPRFIDQGDMDRAILNIGRQDVDVDNIRPRDPRCTILGASGDHLLVNVTAAAGTLKVGDPLAFLPGYSALLAAMTSPYVEKHYLLR
jgi:predicted amino acid racemase